MRKELANSRPEDGAGWETIRTLDQVLRLRASAPPPWESLLPEGLAMPDMSWKDGELLLEGTRRAFRLSPWPAPSAWRREGGREWERADRLAELLLQLWPSLEPGEKPLGDPMGLVSGYRRNFSEASSEGGLFWPVSYYYSLIPPEARAIVGAYHRGRWAMLAFLALDERAIQLARSNPGLAYALALRALPSAAIESPLAKDFHSFLGESQKDILSTLGFPATESARRILAKMDPYSLSPAWIARLRASLSDESVVKALRILPRIDGSVLTLVLDPILRPLASDKLLLQVSEPPDFERMDLVGKGLAASTRLAAMYVKRTGQGGRILPFSSLAQVRRYRKCYEEEALRWKCLRSLDGPDRAFPPPPFPGTEAIRPISSSHGLLLESMEMNNCVRTYIDDIRGGCAYFYKVLEPTRATLAIINKGLFGMDRWQPATMLGRSNRELPREVTEATFMALFSSGSPDGEGG